MNNNLPPTLIIHGDQDPLVPIKQSKRFEAKLIELKVPHELIIRKGAKHSLPTMREDYTLIADWFDKHVPAANQAAK